MVRQQNPGVDSERPGQAHGVDRFAQGVTKWQGAKDGPAPVGNGREEISGASELAAIARHGAASYADAAREWMWCVNQTRCGLQAL
jgi:hypothetical protein